MKKENKKDDRSTNWATVVYPDSAPDNWLQILRDMLIPCFVSPLHDQDYNADGEPKKPHYHVQFCFDSNSKRSRDQIKELTDQIGGVVVPPGEQIKEAPAGASFIDFMLR